MTPVAAARMPVLSYGRQGRPPRARARRLALTREWPRNPHEIERLLICLGGVAGCDRLDSTKMSTRCSVKQVYLDVKSGRELRVGVYAAIIACRYRWY